MNDKELFRLMQFIPDEFPEETAEFLAALQKTARSEAAKPVIREKKTEPRSILWRIMMPVSAAACIALMIGAGVRVALREEPLTETSSQPDITMLAGQTSTAPPVTTLAQSGQKQTGTRTVTAALPEQQTAPPVQSGTSAVTEATTAAAQQHKPQTTAAPAAPNAPETTAAAIPPRNPNYQPGDVNMDGKVDFWDAQLLYNEYLAVVVEGGASILTPEQIALGDVYPNTAQDDMERFVRKAGLKHLLSDEEADFSLIATDYPISFQDSYAVMAYDTEMWLNGKGYTIDLFTVDDFVSYDLHTPPEDEWAQFISPAIVLKGDKLPETEFFTVPDLGDYPVHPENWEMQYAWYKKPGNFILWYDGTGLCADCRIYIYGTNRYDESQMQYRCINPCETEIQEGTMKKFTVGDTDVYCKPNITTSYYEGDDWREKGQTGGRTALEWRAGAYWITVSLDQNYPEEVLRQIAECFAAYPVS